MERKYLDVIDRNVITSIRTVAAAISGYIAHRVLKAESLYLYNFQIMQSLSYRYVFCSVVSSTMCLIYYISPYVLFIDDAYFAQDSVFDQYNARLWAKVDPHGVRVYNFASR